MIRAWILAAGLLAACGGNPDPQHPVVGSALPPGTTRIIVGGDSRDDTAHVLPWAFREAKARGASAFVFLGDMELSPQLDAHFRNQLEILKPTRFFPALGNHEVRVLGALDIGHAAAEKAFRDHFLGSEQTPVASSLSDKVVYSVNLPGHVHFVVLDNVSQSGFGKDQLAWLEADLLQARGDPEIRHIFVGMHQPLAHNGVSTHGMDNDGPQAAAESDAALDMFEHARVELIFASHVHQFAKYSQRNIRCYITGGLGAPLVRGVNAFHHFLSVDVNGDEVRVDVVRFDGKSDFATDEVEHGE